MTLDQRWGDVWGERGSVRPTPEDDAEDLLPERSGWFYVIRIGLAVAALTFLVQELWPRPERVRPVPSYPAGVLTDLVQGIEGVAEGFSNLASEPRATLGRALDRAATTMSLGGGDEGSDARTTARSRSSASSDTGDEAFTAPATRVGEPRPSGPSSGFVGGPVPTGSGPVRPPGAPGPTPNDPGVPVASPAPSPSPSPSPSPPEPSPSPESPSPSPDLPTPSPTPDPPAPPQEPPVDSPPPAPEPSPGPDPSPDPPAPTPSPPTNPQPSPPPMDATPTPSATPVLPG
jgi:hypothetical protein